MKNKIFVIIGALLVTIFLIVGVTYLTSLRRVIFTLQDDVTGAAIYRKDKQKVKDIESDSSVFLQDGAYYAVPVGESLSKNPINFTVDGESTAIYIDPPYSKAYFSELLKTERPAIVTAISNKYPSLIGSYTLTHETLYKRGEWFGGLLEPKVSDRRDIRDPYRIVLHKEDGKWQVIRRPEYILSSSRYQEVPIDVLRAINLISR